MTKARKSEFYGYYDLIFSPDDGAWYADLIWENIDSPFFATKEKAQVWAEKHGGVFCLRVSP